MKKLAIMSIAAMAALSLGTGIAPAKAFADSSHSSMKQHQRLRAYHMRDIALSNDKSTATAVILGGTPIMRFRNSAGGYSPEQRALETQDRLNDILSTGPIAPSDITTDLVDGEGVVLVKGQLLFTADSETAFVNDSTPLELANIWADRMRGILPELTAAK
jgi:hypothetical protein